MQSAMTLERIKETSAGPTRNWPWPTVEHAEAKNRGVGLAIFQ